MPLTRHHRAASLARVHHLPTPGLDEIVDFVVDFATPLFRESRTGRRGMWR